MRVPHVMLIDEPGSGSDGADLVAMFGAMQRSLDDDFAPIYNLTATLSVGSASEASSANMVMLMQADPDQPGALGDHDYIKGKPLSRIFPLLDKQDGANLSTTTDHELKEMLRDFFLASAIMGLDGQFWADEDCDAVEQDEFTVDGVSLSNFVLPAWYIGGGKFDFLGKLTAPLTVTPGGYAQFFDPQQGWQQITHESKKPRSYRLREFGRSTKRRLAFHRRPTVDEKFSG